MAQNDYVAAVTTLLEIETMSRGHANLIAIHELAMRELVGLNASAAARLVEMKKEEDEAKIKAAEEAAKVRKAQEEKEAAEAKKLENDAAKAHAAEAKSEAKHQRA